MLKKVLGAGAAFVLLLSFTSAFQNQGFTQYQETEGTISFSCTQQCVILYDEIKKYDQLQVQGTLQGEGGWVVGFLVGESFYPLVQQQPGAIDQTLLLRDNPVFGQVPADQARLAVLFQGNLTSTDLRLRATTLGTSQKVAKGFRDFFTNEPLRPYSINLRYGIKILGTPLVKIVYRIFIIGAVYILFSKKYVRRRLRSLAYLGIALFLLMGARNLFNRIDRTSEGLQQYTFASTEQKTFFDLGDYIAFTTKIRETLELDEAYGKKECTIYVDTPQDRPFGAHRELVYLKPCERTKEKGQADYIIVYKKPRAIEDADKEVLVEFNGSYLLANN